MYTFLIVVIALIALVLMVVVLLQSGKGGGLAGIASGGQATQILGARQAPDFLEKATWSLATVFILLCLVTSFFTGTSADDRRSVIEGLDGAPIQAPAQPAPITPEPFTPTPPTPTPE